MKFFVIARWWSVLLYLDNVVVFPKSHSETIERLRYVFLLLYKVGVLNRVRELKFFTKKINHLVHTIWLSRLELEEYTTNAIAKLERPNLQMELHFFLGLCNRFWCFAPNLACFVAFLNNNLGKYEPKQLDPLMKVKSSAIVPLMKVSISSPLLSLPRNISL